MDNRIHEQSQLISPGAPAVLVIYTAFGSIIEVLEELLPASTVYQYLKRWDNLNFPQQHYQIALPQDLLQLVNTD